MNLIELEFCVCHFVGHKCGALALDTKVYELFFYKCIFL